MAKNRYVYDAGDPHDEGTPRPGVSGDAAAITGVTSAAPFQRGVRLGLDVGMARVGVAACDPDGMLAMPVATEPRAKAVRAVALHLATLDARAIVIGLPRTLRGTESASAAMAREFAQQLHEFLSASGVYVPIRLIDERFTTVSAHSALSASGRKHKSHRSVVDQVAAVMILQHALDSERSTGTPAGDLFAPRGE
ncbi:Holliday junction resolvase RuvX [Micrococcales bacterium 31B]|nr:Holliday junction resolvase RuvX [Micrococcales bacterium 31B]